MFPRRHNPILIAIAFSLLVVGFSYWFSHRGIETSEIGENTLERSNAVGDAIRGIEPTDHILGNPTAPIVFIVYSDFSCTYCKEYHKTLRTLMRFYGPNGEVAIVFRHMPFVQLHPEAPMYALASECVAQEKGSTGFWNFGDKLFEAADPLKPLGAAELVLLAEKVGVDRQTFVACMRSNELMTVVESDFNEALGAGIKGTPYTIIDDPIGRTTYEGTQTFRVLAEGIQTTLRTLNIDELASPSTGSYMQDFDALAEPVTPTPTGTSSTATTTPLQKQSSILDGIIEE